MFIGLSGSVTSFQGCVKPPVVGEKLGRPLLLEVDLIQDAQASLAHPLQ